MTGGAAAAAVGLMTGKCPEVIKVEPPIGKTLYLDVIPGAMGVCSVIKDAGDDPDVTDKSEIVTQVESFPKREKSLSLAARDRCITEEGLKLPVGRICH